MKKYFDVIHSAFHFIFHIPLFGIHVKWIAAGMLSL